MQRRGISGKIHRYRVYRIPSDVSITLSLLKKIQPDFTWQNTLGLNKLYATCNLIQASFYTKQPLPYSFSVLPTSNQYKTCMKHTYFAKNPPPPPPPPKKKIIINKKYFFPRFSDHYNSVRVMPYLVFHFFIL